MSVSIVTKRTTYSTYDTITDVLIQRADKEGQKPVYTFLNEDRNNAGTIRFEELFARAKALAARLQTEGFTGERIILLLPPGLEYLIAFYGCLLAGTVAVPSYPPDPYRLNRSLPRLYAMAEDAEAVAVITNQSIKKLFRLLAVKEKIQSIFNLKRINRYIPGYPSQDNILTTIKPLLKLKWFDIDKIDFSFADYWQLPSITKHDIAFLQYTSGSTGNPKGVMISHGNLITNLEQKRRALGLNSSFGAVMWLPLYHDMGLIGGVLQSLYSGVHLRFMSPIDFLQHPIRWLEEIHKADEESIFSGSPNFGYDLCARKATLEDIAKLDLSKWRVAVSGAEPVRAETLRRFCRTFEAANFDPKAFFPGYGLAEATLIVSTSLRGKPPHTVHFHSELLGKKHAVPVDADHPQATEFVSCGKPVENIDVRIVNPENKCLCPDSTVGEIWVKGDNISRGYWNRQHENEIIFEAYTSDTEEGPFLRTGDLGVLLENHLYIVGRIKDLIILRGRNYYPQDIEYTVEKCDQAIRPGCSAAFNPDETKAERLFIVAEVRSTSKPNLRGLVEKIRQAVVHEHEVIPDRITLIPPRTIPKTSSGKIQRRECKSMLLEKRLPIVLDWWKDHTGDRILESTSSATSPSTDQSNTPKLINEIRKIVAFTLQIPEKDLKDNKPLQGFGIDSLAALELKNAIEETYHVEITISSLLKKATVASITQFVEQYGTKGAIDEDLRLVQIRREEAEIPESFPLSYGQRDLFFQHQLNPKSIFNPVYAFRLLSPVDETQFRDALAVLIKRHAQLRATFHMEQGQPVQRIHKEMPAPFEIRKMNFSHESEILAEIEKEAKKPFDLANGPLFNFILFQPANGHSILLFKMHHIICDMWSLSILIDELATLLRNGDQTNPLPPIKYDYSYFVQWQRHFLQERENELLAFWKSRLSGELPLLNLPTDRPRPSVPTYTGVTVHTALGINLSRRLRTLSEIHGVTLFITMLSAYAVLLNRYTGQSESVIGIPTAARTQAEFSRIFGYFVNVLPLRIHTDTSVPLYNFLHNLEEQVSLAFDYMDYPMGLMVEKLMSFRDSEHTPLFQNIFVFQKTPLHQDNSITDLALGREGSRISLHGVTLESLKLNIQTALYDLTFMVAESGEDIHITVTGNADIFERTTIERFLHHYRQILRYISKNTLISVNRIPLLSSVEARRICKLMHLNKQKNIQFHPVHRLIEEQANSRPLKTALIFEKDQRNYNELNAEANQLARYLSDLGIGRESTVGICMERRPLMIVSILAVLKTGAAYIPLDPALPDERIRYICHDSGTKLILTSAKLYKRLEKSDLGLLNLETTQDIYKQLPSENLNIPIYAEQLAYIIYTSGTTGKPKGTMLSHSGLSNNIQSMIKKFHIKPDSRILNFASFSFDASVEEIFTALCNGATLVLPSEKTVHSLFELHHLINTYEITNLTLSPSMLSVMGDVSLPSLRSLVSAGEKCSSELAGRWRDIPHFINAYGPTEATICTTTYEMSKDLNCNIVPIGKPIDGVEAYVLDEHLNLLPAGVPGELYIGGKGLARGYINRPDLTAAMFIPNPFGGPGERLYRSGDLVKYLPDGNLVFLHRVDRQVKLRGYRIEPDEVECAMKEFPGINDALVFPDQENNSLIAYYIPENENNPKKISEAELRSYLNHHIPSYMVPAHLISIESIPLTSNGKVNYRALPQPSRTANVTVRPKNDLEEKLLEIWKKVLHTDSINPLQNLFELGGHSIHILQIQNEIKQKLNFELNVVDIFRYPTVRSLADFLVSGKNYLSHQLKLARNRAERQKEATRIQRKSYQKRKKK